MVLFEQEAVRLPAIWQNIYSGYYIPIHIGDIVPAVPRRDEECLYLRRR